MVEKSCRQFKKGLSLPSKSFSLTPCGFSLHLRVGSPFTFVWPTSTIPGWVSSTFMWYFSSACMWVSLLSLLASLRLSPVNELDHRFQLGSGSPSDQPKFRYSNYIGILWIGIGVLPLPSHEVPRLELSGCRQSFDTRGLKELIRDSNLELVFLSETKSKSPRINNLKARLKFANCFCVEPVGRAGGLALFWSLGVELEVVYSDKNVISALVYSDPPNSPWMLFAIYGPCLWLVIGDLNCIKRADEKRGGCSSPESSINCLRDFMTNTGAIDLGFNGPSFTWSNRREGLANIKERLDQCLCDRDWQILFPKAGVKHLSNANSDHNPILLDTHLEPENLNRPFRFEAMWTKDERSSIVVENAWQANVEGSNGFRLARKLEETKKDLKKWNKEVFGLVRERIKAIQANIAEIQQKSPTKENLELEASLNLELDDWLTKEELRWKQKSRELWLKEGDRNSRFFHLSTLNRRRRNRISEIKLEDGSWINNIADIQDYFERNFSSLYQSSNPHIPRELENLIDSCISDEDNAELCRIPSRDEIRKVLVES
nr:hypothetical protein CFP56_33154 [Quercus suber]